MEIFSTTAVGNAFAVLSDAEKKKQYDLYGPEEYNNTSSQHRNSYSSHHDFTRGYESKCTALFVFDNYIRINGITVGR